MNYYSKSSEYFLFNQKRLFIKKDHYSSILFLSDKKVSENLVQITEGAHDIHKDVRFTQDLFVNNLTAFKFLNNIPVRGDGGLDVLLKDTPEEQSITGVKTFENLELYDSIKLQGKIDGKFFFVKELLWVTISNILEPR